MVKFHLLWPWKDHALDRRELSLETDTSAYQLLSLVALSGECSVDIINYMGISPSYVEKLITKLKDDGYIKTHYRDRLRGYRLTNRGKKLLLGSNPDRFLFYLSGNTDTNRPRSDFTRRLRLQQTSIVYVMLQNAGVCLYRDEKNLLFSQETKKQQELRLPAFYQAREIKELGAEAVKINNSRTMGVLLAPRRLYAVYYTGGSLMKWEYRTELKVKTLLQFHTGRGVLSKNNIYPWYHPDTPIRALIIGENMEMAIKLMRSTGGYKKSFFCLDASFDGYHFIPAAKEGEVMLRILCNPELKKELESLLVSDLLPVDRTLGLEHDAVSEGLPVLLCHDFEMLRITRFCTSLSLHGLKGKIICFDFQKAVLEEFLGGAVMIETIDLEKFKRRYLADVG